MTDICCIGHITLDKVITPVSEVQMPGGTAWYFSSAMSRLDEFSYRLVTSLAPTEERFADELRQMGVSVDCYPSRHTVYFENTYGDNPDHRSQRVLQVSDPFTSEQVLASDARFYHLGPLLAGDIPSGLIRILAVNGMVSLDVQGYLREVKDRNVFPRTWHEMKEVLPFVDILKANDSELETMTGCSDIHEGAKRIAAYGVKEVVVTLGSKGSLILSEGEFISIPAWQPQIVADATGCGDTYMAGYLYQRAKGSGIRRAGEFAAAIATLKIEAPGPFRKSKADIERLLSGG